MDETTSKPFAMVLGRKTYDIMAAFWPDTPEGEGAKVFNDATKYVASRSRPTLEWSNSVLLEGDAAQAIAALKAEDGPELQAHGSANLIQTLLQHDLVDGFRLWQFPVVLDKGKRLFANGSLPAAMRLVNATTSSTGVVISTYERAGKLEGRLDHPRPALATRTRHGRSSTGNRRDKEHR